MSDGDYHSQPDDDDEHILQGNSCWCNPEVEFLDGERYILHRNRKGHTILTDPMLKN